MVTIGEASRLSGLSIEAIRFYEREGIVARPDRGTNNRRRYTTQQVGRLAQIKNLRNLGFSLGDAQVLTSLETQQNADCKAVLMIAQSHIQTVRDKIAELKSFELALLELTENCQKGHVGCPMLAQLQNGMVFKIPHPKNSSTTS